MLNTLKNNLIPTIAAYSLTGCAGELLVILDLIEKLIPRVKIISFPFAQSNNEFSKVDIAFVEGSVSQSHDLEKLKNIRLKANYLVALGNCAIWGCVQKNGCRGQSLAKAIEGIYGNESEIEPFNSSPLSEYVKVDVQLSGCPVNSNQLLAVIASLLKDQMPYITHKPLCLECKLKEIPCVLIEKNLPCLGPITAAGCGALCTTVGSACYGCWGPCEDPQMDSMALLLTKKGFDLEEVITRLTTFGAPKTLFKRMDKFEKDKFERK